MIARLFFKQLTSYFRRTRFFSEVLQDGRKVAQISFFKKNALLTLDITSNSYMYQGIYKHPSFFSIKRTKENLNIFSFETIIS